MQLQVPKNLFEATLFHKMIQFYLKRLHLKIAFPMQLSINFNSKILKCYLFGILIELKEVYCCIIHSPIIPNMKIRLQIIRARLNFHMMNDNPKVSFGIGDCSLHNRHINLTTDYESSNPMAIFIYCKTLLPILTQYRLPFLILKRYRRISPKAKKTVGSQ